MRVPFEPPPGLNSDATKFEAPGVWNTGSNVRFYHGKPQCVGGETSLQSASLETYSAACKLFAYKVSGVSYLAIARSLNTTSILQIINTTTWSRTSIGPSGLGTPTNASMAMFGDILLFTPKGQTLYTSTAGGACASVAAAPDNITAMLVTPSRQVMALGCNEEVSTTFNGRCIRWCDIEDYTDWTTSSSNNAGEYILPGQDDIVGGCILGDNIIVWTTSAIWLGQFIGQPSQTFIFTRIDVTGIIAQDCWAILRGTVYWMSAESKFYGYRIGGLPFEIACPVGFEVFSSNIGPNSTYNAVAIRRFGEIWFSFGTLTTTTAFCYCVDESANVGHPVWFKAKGFAAAVDDPILAGGLNMDETTCIKIHSSSNTNFPLMAFDKQFSGSIPAWEITSSYFYLDQGKGRFQIQRMTNDENGDYGSYKVQLSARNYPDTSSLSGQNDVVIVNDAVTAKADFRNSGRVVSARFHDDDGTASATAVWRLGKPVFDVVPLGNR